MYCLTGCCSSPYDSCTFETDEDRVADSLDEAIGHAAMVASDNGWEDAVRLLMVDWNGLPTSEEIATTHCAELAHVLTEGIDTFHDIIDGWFEVAHALASVCDELASKRIDVRASISLGGLAS